MVAEAERIAVAHGGWNPASADALPGQGQAAVAGTPEAGAGHRRAHRVSAIRTARTIRITPVSRSMTRSTAGRVNQACNRSMSRM